MTTTPTTQSSTNSAVRLIGIAGVAGSGKDTVCDFVAAQADTLQHLMFAEPIKEAVLVMFGAYVTRDDVYGPSENRNKQIGDLKRNDGQPLTIRHVLQTLGTEWGRECCYHNVWVDIALQRARTATAGVAVITDCRFDNEFQAIRDAGGELWHLERPGAGLSGEAGLHESERDLFGPVLRELRTAHIVNDSTLDDLAAKVEGVLRHA